MMSSEFIRQQLNHSKWFVGNVNDEENSLVTFLPIISSATILMVVFIPLNDFVPTVFELTQTQLEKQCQNQGFTGNASLNQIKQKLMNIVRSPKSINQFEIVDSQLSFHFSLSAMITVSIKSLPHHVTRDICFAILQNLSLVLLQLASVSTQYQNIQGDILGEKQKCIDFLLRSVNDLDGGTKIISQWAPETSKNHKFLQPVTDDDIVEKLLTKGNVHSQTPATNSLKRLLTFQDICDINQSTEPNESTKAPFKFSPVNELDDYDDDFEPQSREVDPLNRHRPNSHSTLKSEGNYKENATKRSATLLPFTEDFSRLESTSPERTRSESATPSVSSSADTYPRKKRKFGKIKIKN
ncbi:hypothetical protein SEUBUCD650_0L03170 [Saccharomyces eubayanus]|uniref:NEJ1-like protein n=1 Tax=Saccharomyces eubayanus TaxID=1080349 RepID=A0ABN8VHG1_SACEU|nr:hypothetical protein SEUBUCD650_0L03170 [Saccharomyces eubayanus]